jgi:hypothetical protein
VNWKSSLKHAAIAVVALLACAASARAQSRPLATEDPETIGAGQILIEAGYDYQHQLFYPASGLTGNLSRVGTFGMNFGVSSIAEIQVKGGLQDWLSITNRVPAPLSSMLTVTGDTTRDFEDAIIGAKVRFAGETASRPSMAVKFSTRLPNTGNESGLGLDTTDFNFGFLIGKTVQSVRFVGNVGFGILGEPDRGDDQNDVFNYGVSAARAVATGVELVADLNGRISTRNGTPPVGTESRSMVRLGSRFTHGPVRIDAAFMIGVTKNDPQWGITTGVTWVFKAFTVPPQ